MSRIIAVGTLHSNASMFVKVVGSARYPILTFCGSAQVSISPGRRLQEVEVGRVVGKEGVQVPGEGVLLIKNVTYDMARDGVNTLGQYTMRKASS